VTEAAIHFPEAPDTKVLSFFVLSTFLAFRPSTARASQFPTAFYMEFVAHLLLLLLLFPAVLFCSLLNYFSLPFSVLSVLSYRGS
jgi:nitrate reductase gamma subunit